MGGAASALGAKLPPIDAADLAKTPWVVGAAAILAALIIYWLGSILSAFAANEGLDFRQRLLRILGPGDTEWAFAVLVAVALLVLGSSAESRTALANILYQVLLLAAAVLVVASVINAVIEITYIGDSFDAAITGFLQYLAAVPIAAAAGLWAWRSNPVALPGSKTKPA